MRVLLLILLLSACTEQADKKPPPPDDGCVGYVGYVIKPDGSKTCLGK